MTANQVKDKDSLRAFVLSAKEHLEKNYDQAVKDFRTKEKWKKGFIYLHGLTMDGTTLFHVALPELEGKNLLNAQQIGNTIIKPLLSAGKKGEGFVEYTQDNPATEDADQSKKIGYVTTFKKDGVDYIVGSGFYLDSSK
ncbi:MAG: cache domain-containing protein [Oligoflexia bacterium]|nr:cache domain-containing protein [Oligoflexia bacterium]